ncbi:hypothetical protein ACFX13_035437 [Malus domestica]
MFSSGKKLSLEKSKEELLTISSAKAKKCIDSVETMNSVNKRLQNILKEECFVIVNKLSQELCEAGERISEFIQQVDCLECHAKENLSFQAELVRKEDAAGVTKPSTQINPSAAEEAPEQLKNKITLMDRELQDLKFTNKISSERIRLSELMPQTSLLRSRKDENCQTRKRMS